jgi:hypothetical protein
VDLENQLARKAATEKRRRHAQREAVEFDVVGSIFATASGPNSSRARITIADA